MTIYDDPNRECVGLEPIWTQTGDNIADVAATGATAGTPGTWTPAGANVIPASASAATSAGIVASPATAWTVDQYMQGTTAGAAGQMYWNGTAWAGGKAPAAG